MNSKNNDDLFIPSHVTNLFIKMDFVSHVPSGFKICVNSNMRSYIDPQDRSTTLYRWYYGESGTTTCDFIEKIVNEVYELLRIENSLDYRIKEKIYQKSSSFMDGITSLIITYADNPDASSKLRTSKEKLELKISSKTSTIPALID